MPAPAKFKTWQFSANMTELGVGSDSARKAFVRVKDALKGFALNPWTVRGSSDAATFSLGDNVDRLTDYTKIVKSAAGNRSWIVLQSPAGMQVCFEFNNGSYWFYATVAISKTSVGFTGGSLTARPTATDEIVLGTGPGNFAWGPTHDVHESVFHVLHSTDGLSTQVHFCRLAEHGGMWLFGKAVGYIPEWTDPLYSLVIGSAAGGITSSHLWNTSNTFMRGWKPDGSSMNLYATPESYYNNSPWPVHSDVPDAYTGEYALGPVGLWSNTVGGRGRHGVFPDLWITSPAAVNGTTMHEQTFGVLGYLAIPWDGENNLQMTV